MSIPGTRDFHHGLLGVLFPVHQRLLVNQGIYIIETLLS